MIKQIVFDMGNVLVDYVADKVCHVFTEDKQMAKEVAAAVFVSPEWILLDMGLISQEEGIRAIEARLDTEEKRQLASRCFWHWHEYDMTAKPGMEELVRELKESGYGIYLCSNASIRMLSCYQEILPAVECFDGILFSADVKCLKPQKEIYFHLFQRFALKPEECFFIDDLEGNIQGARDCGMEGYCFADGNLSRLREVLRGLRER